MFSTEQLLRAALDDREREIQTQLRVHRLIGAGRPTMHWLHRDSRPFQTREGGLQRAR
jgi:hypothetical protein